MPASAPEGLCPKCLLLGVAAPTDSGAGQARPMPPTLGAVAAAFPQLEILEFIGRGGMGCVFKARQPQLNRFVALKVLPEALARDPAFAGRFVREAQALAALNHPNIVTVHDFGQSGGFFYLLMEFVDGVNLRQALRGGRFTPEQALAIVPPICDALQFAHERGIVHRDIKPENLLLDKAGRVKIADFGIAKMVCANANPLTRPSDTLSPSEAEGQGEGAGMMHDTAAGTPHYVAPEQKDKPQQADHRADIYSLGVVLYEMLTGELPQDKLQPPSRKVQIDVRLDEVVLRALEQSPELRWQTAADLRTQVETIANSGKTDGGLSRAGRSASVGGRTTLAGVAGLCLPSALFAWFVLVGHRRNFGVDLDADVQLWTGLIGFPLSAGFGLVLAWLAGSFREPADSRATAQPPRWPARAIAAMVLLMVSVLLMGGGMVMIDLATQDPNWNPAPAEVIFVLIVATGGLIAAASATFAGWSARKQIRREPQRWRGWGGAFAAAWFWPGVAFGLLVLSLPVLVHASRGQNPADRAATREATRLAFGMVTERVVCNAYYVNTNCAIDLDSGRLYPLPDTFVGSAGNKNDAAWFLSDHSAAKDRPESASADRDGRAWVASNRIDAVGVWLHAGNGLKGYGLFAVRQPARAWDQITPAEVQSELRRAKAETNGSSATVASMIAPGNLPATFLFRTREGGSGLLQITGFTDRPAGVTIRYKLVQDAAAAPALRSQTVESLPPVVVGTKPASGARDVPPGIAEIRVRFSKEMTDGSWSWTTAWTNSTPEVVAGPRYDPDRRTCLMKVTLEPGRTYAWWLNSEQFQNFKDKNGRPAVPYLLIFQTRGKEGSP